MKIENRPHNRPYLILKWELMKKSPIIYWKYTCWMQYEWDSDLFVCAQLCCE